MLEGYNFNDCDYGEGFLRIEGRREFSITQI